ncbi:butyrophilin-like protein 10 [Leucoraja erinacea]|uniref:butyrophilin-like protein 10 n=1 Tax=Leucoraja erinaceus TaxID=7782 RepID=UPI00245576D8|nr:butyrophilin-like protein 10 [Leucoraja erinacea]
MYTTRQRKKLKFKYFIFPEEFNVIVPDSPVVAMVGEDVLLECQKAPDTSLAALDVRWFTTSPGSLVHVYTSGEDRAELQDGPYRGRTGLLREEFPRGNASLKRKRVKVSDAGMCTCSISTPTSRQQEAMRLQVEGVSLWGHRVHTRVYTGNVSKRPHRLGFYWEVQGLLAMQTAASAGADLLGDAVEETCKTDHCWLKGKVTTRRWGGNAEVPGDPTNNGWSFHRCYFCDSSGPSILRYSLARHMESPFLARYMCNNVFTDYIPVAGFGHLPWIRFEESATQGMRVVCKSDGWFPKPVIRWLDGSGQDVTARFTEDSSGLITVHSHIDVTSDSANRYSCYIRSKRLRKTQKAHLQISDMFINKVNEFNIWLPIFWAFAGFV